MPKHCEKCSLQFPTAQVDVCLFSLTNSPKPLQSQQNSLNQRSTRLFWSFQRYHTVLISRLSLLSCRRTVDQFTIIQDKEKQQILTFKKLELDNVWHLCLKMTLTICQNLNSWITFGQWTDQLIALLFQLLLGDMILESQLFQGSRWFIFPIWMLLLRCYQCLLSLYSFVHSCFQTSIIWGTASSQTAPLRVLCCLKALMSRATEDQYLLLKYKIDVSHCYTHWTNLIIALSLEQMLWIIAWQWLIS